ncbi:MAG TPA: DUF1552 domain-containing protein [Terriglobia bacterium]|nr:DUF1552 domain-containing protein [Terriglobia bacterium]
MFITKKHMPRRTFLKGAGVTLSLPLLSAMIPAQTALAQTAATPKTRFMGIFYPHGMAPGHWEHPEGAFPEKMSNIMESLQPVRNQTVVVGGMWTKSAEAPPGTTGSDHWVAAAFLSGNKPRKTSGSDSTVFEPTIDQVIAEKIGRESILPSLQVAVEDPNSSSSNCGEGYSCSYTNSISWVSAKDPKDKTATLPLPMELDPQVVFERLFGSGATPEVRAARMKQTNSILDSLLGELSGVKKNLGTSDRRTIDQYLDNVREIERRLELAKHASAALPDYNEPNGIPSTYDEHIKLHYDLIALGFQADITRVATLLGARDLTGASYPLPKSDLFPDGGTSPSYHGASHHQDNPNTIANYAKIARYHVSKMAYFAQKLKSIPDGDGTLLDHSLILYGTNMGNSNQHQHYDVPHILVGGAGGQLKGGRHITFDRKTWRTGSLLLNVMDMYGIHQEKQGDSHGDSTLQDSPYAGRLPKL